MAAALSLVFAPLAAAPAPTPTPPANTSRATHKPLHPAAGDAKGAPAQPATRHTGTSEKKHVAHGKTALAPSAHHDARSAASAHAHAPTQVTARGSAGHTQPGAARDGGTDNDAVDPEQAQALKEENASQRQQLKARLDELRQEISAGEATRNEAADALASSEQAISDANRRLHDLALQQATAQADLGSINTRRTQARSTIAAQQAALSKLLHDQYLGGGEDPFKLLFSGDNPNRIARDFEYLGYVSRAQAAMLANLQQSIANLDDLSHQASQRTAELDAIGQETSAQRAQLLSDEDTRKATLAAISEKLQSQRAEAGKLERDDERLAKVVDELSKLIERQAKERAERAEKARQVQIARDRERERARLEAQKKADAEEAARAAEAQARANEAKNNGSPAPIAAAPPPVATPPPPVVQKPEPAPRAEESETTVAMAGFDGHFARMKGSLKLPVKGDLLSHFGATRAGGGPAWKGLFIQAPTGSEVHAVAPGRVVFAEWLRGFGNLLIIDHGDQYLSVYGNNESLLKQPGDVVQTGDLVATAGNSGGNPETGLYFELRYQGKPFDPLSWTGGR
jgi:septal ring factor EnvC (AmiA/AmiB activator)